MPLPKIFLTSGVSAALAVFLIGAGPGEANAAPALSPIVTSDTGVALETFDGLAEPARHRSRRHDRRHRRYHHRRPSFNLDFVIRPRFYSPPPVIYAPAPVPHYGNTCNYWRARCEANWRRYNDILGCLRYHGCL